MSKKIEEFLRERQVDEKVIEHLWTEKVMCFLSFLYSL
jgi:hypothetical protein